MPAPEPPEFFVKTGLHVEPLPSNEELWATGLVAYLWNIYSNHITEWGMILTRTNPAARRVFSETIGLKQRTRLVRELVRRNAKPQYRKQWIDLLNRGGSLQIQRDKIVHGDWAYTAATDTKPEGPKFLWDHFKAKGDYVWKLNYETIFETAKRIDKLILDCLIFRFELMRPEDGANFRPSLLRRLTSPDRPLTRLDRLLSYLPTRIERLIRREPSP